jgi:hypothetical protein
VEEDIAAYQVATAAVVAEAAIIGELRARVF